MFRKINAARRSPRNGARQATAHASMARLDDCIYALALVIARRQMRGQWLSTLGSSMT